MLSVITYGCPSCTRRFVAFGEVSKETLVCPCGVALVPEAVPDGLYELGSRAVARAHEPEQPPHEPDGGYGASHGYDASHGGPSGPGDAPAGGESND